MTTYHITHNFNSSSNECYLLNFRGLHLAKVLHCPHDKKNIRDTIKCLHSKNASDLVHAERQNTKLGVVEYPFVPVLDGFFLTETPQKSLVTKNFKKTNILMGINKNEGVLNNFYKNKYNDSINKSVAVADLNPTVSKIGQEVVYTY